MQTDTMPPHPTFPKLVLRDFTYSVFYVGWFRYVGSCKKAKRINCLWTWVWETLLQTYHRSYVCSCDLSPLDGAFCQASTFSSSFLFLSGTGSSICDAPYVNGGSLQRFISKLCLSIFFVALYTIKCKSFSLLFIV